MTGKRGEFARSRTSNGNSATKKGKTETFVRVSWDDRKERGQIIDARLSEFGLLDGRPVAQVCPSVCMGELT